MQVSVADAKNNLRLPELIRAVENREPVTITRHGQPVVDIVRTKNTDTRKPKFGTLRDLVKEIDPDWWKPMTQEEADAFLEGRY